MTIQELFNYAKEKDILNYIIHVHHSDDGGYYYGTRPVTSEEMEIDDNYKEIIL